MIPLLRSLFLLIIVVLSYNTALTQSVERKDISRTGIWVAPGMEREKNYPVHITDRLIYSPSGQESLRKHKERKELIELGFEVQTYTTTQSSVGDRRDFWVQKFEDATPTAFEEIEFELRAAGNLSEIWIEVDEFGPEKIPQEVIDDILIVLEEKTPPRSYDPDRGIIEINIELFGNPPDIDGSGKVKVLLVNIRDGWDPDEGGGFITGFFHPADQNPGNTSSNRADILYINTYPGIYMENQPADPKESMSTIAHELQHLIHFGYGQPLNLFQNEGQSEFAEILNGFDARTMTFLNDPDEISGNSTIGLYRWRSDFNELLMDYQRAGLFHSYLSERIGPIEAGKLTQAGTSGRTAYQSVLNNSEINWQEFLADFYVTNWVNDLTVDEKFGYNLPQLRNIQVLNPGVSYNSGSESSWVFNKEVSLTYGGANYTNWFGVENLRLYVNGPDGIRHYVASRKPDDASYSVGPLSGSMTLNGLYESITLISVATYTGSLERGLTSFKLTADWDRTNLAQKEYAYHTDIAHYTPLYGDLEDEPEVYSVRFTPRHSGNFNKIAFSINNHPQAITGTGVLRLTLSKSRIAGGSGANQTMIPTSEVIGYEEVHLSDLTPGVNYLSIKSGGWLVEKDTNYHLVFEIINGSANSYMELLLDAGSNDTDNENYYPVRTLISKGGSSGWLRFSQHNNLVVSMNLIYPDDSLKQIIDSEAPFADTFVLEQNYPNPFNPVTLIRYNLVEEVPVRLEVYDLLGRRIQTLVDEHQGVGSYTVEFDGSGLTSGIYLYRIQAGSYRQTGKMTLTK